MTETARPDIETILAKVQKMLNVTGRSPEEAAAYVEKAHAILAQYDLSIEDVGQLKADPRTAVAKTEGAVATTTQGKPDGWKSDLLYAVAQSFECKVMRTYVQEETKRSYRYVTHYQLVGFKHDLDAARYAHSFLVGEITRLAKEYARTHWDAIAELAKNRGISHHDAESHYKWVTGTHPLKAELYFIKGATQTVSHSLIAQAAARRKDATEANPNALVVQKSDAVDEFVGRDQYGDEWEEVKARRQRLAEEFEARRNTEPDAEPERVESPSQRRRREAAEERKRERWYRSYMRQQALVDHDALGAGQRAGREISIRPGIAAGAGKEAIG